MPLASLTLSLRDTSKVLSDSWKVLKQHPEVTLYPYAATIFVSITYPLVSATVFAGWYGRIFYNAGLYVPHKLGLILGLVGFSVFYAALVSAYFSCAVAAGVISKLENRPTPPLYGLLRVIKNFWRVTRFAVLSVFFFPIGIYAQRRKLPGDWLPVLGSSLTLRMAQVAPAILTTDKKVGDTVRESVDVIGRAWRPSLVLKVVMYGLIFLVIILPKLIQQGFFKSPSAGSFGWILSIELGASGLVGFKVLNSIFTAVMYHQAKNNKNT
jgi:hypothetical protein